MAALPVVALALITTVATGASATPVTSSCQATLPSAAGPTVVLTPIKTVLLVPGRGPQCSPVPLETRNVLGETFTFQARLVATAGSGAAGGQLRPQGRFCRFVGGCTDISSEFGYATCTEASAPQGGTCAISLGGSLTFPTPGYIVVSQLCMWATPIGTKSTNANIACSITTDVIQPK